MKIVLEECFKAGKHMGTIVIYKTALTPQFLGKLKADKADKMGWRRYKETLREEGVDVDEW